LNFLQASLSLFVIVVKETYDCARATVILCNHNVGEGEKIIMMMFHRRPQIALSILGTLFLVTHLVEAQLQEQDDVGRVSVQGEEDDRIHNHESSRWNDEPDDSEKANAMITDQETFTIESEGDDQPVAGTQVPPIQTAWIHYFDAADDKDVEDTNRESSALEDPGIQGTKEYIIVYKQIDDFGIAEEILAATDATIQSTVVDNGGSITYEYNAAVNGVSASLTREAMEELMKQDGIDFIEEVVPMYITTTWGQDRVDEKERTSSNLDYKWERDRSAGAGVNVCVRLAFRVSKRKVL
jgi:hypothetical protein